MKKTNTNATTETTTQELDVSTMNKQGLFDFLKSHDGDKSLGKSLLDRIAYTVKCATADIKKVTKEDLFDLADELSMALTPAVPAMAPAPVENMVKAKLPAKKSKTPAKKVEEPVEEETDEEEEEEPAKTPAKKTIKGKKDTTKTKEPKKDTTPSFFPKTIELAELGSMTSLQGKLTKYGDIVKAVADGRQLVLACHWEEDEMDNYSEMNEVDVPEGGFPRSLDLLQTVVVGENIQRLWAASVYTEAMFWFTPEDFEYVEVGTVKMRLSEGMAFELYELKDAE